MEDTQTDVNQVETTTPESSTEEQTTSTEQVSTEDKKTVPYERFREVNEKAKQVETLQQKLTELEARLQPKDANPQADVIREQLKKLGFAPREEVLSEVQKEFKQREQDALVKSEVESLSTRYDGKDGRPKFEANKAMEYALQNGLGSLEAAYKLMHEKDLLDWHVKQAVTKSRGIETEGSDGSGSSQVGTTNADLKTRIRQGDRGALKTFIRRVTSSE